MSFIAIVALIAGPIERRAVGVLGRVEGFTEYRRVQAPDLRQWDDCSSSLKFRYVTTEPVIVEQQTPRYDDSS